MLISDFTKYVTPSATGAPGALVRQAVLEAAQEFLTDTQVWNEVQDAIPLQSGVQVYSMEAPVGARCIDIKDIYAPFLPAGKLTGVTLEHLSQIMPNWETATGNAPAYFTRAFDLCNFSVYPKPVAPLPTPNGHLTVRGVYTLTETATSIPDVIVHRWRDAIAAGAKARLLWMSEKTWSNPKLADKAERDFKLGKSRARIRAVVDNTPGSNVVTPRVFGSW